jgi:formate hydrogenlyase subunit 3/multisubunit Na+/H+ antiporter MnhD subunit
MTWIIATGFVAILGSLVAALIIMMRRGEVQTFDDNGNPVGEPSKPKGNMATALAFRIGLSVLLFLFVLFAYSMGWIQPTGIAPGR